MPEGEVPDLGLPPEALVGLLPFCFPPFEPSLPPAPSFFPFPLPLPLEGERGREVALELALALVWCSTQGQLFPREHFPNLSH